MKKGYWTLLIAIIIVIAFSIALLSNPLSYRAKGRAEEFLKTFYTIENTDIADRYHEIILQIVTSSYYDSSMERNEELKMIEELIKSKYDSLVTEDFIEREIANRTLLAGEMTAREYGSRMEPKKIDLKEYKVYDSGRITYDFEVQTLVKYKDGSSKSVTSAGRLDMIESDGSWKVHDIRLENINFTRALIFRQENLYITNLSKALINKIEVTYRGVSQGAMNADNSDLEENDRFGFEMMDAQSLDYIIKLLDKDDKVLLKQNFVSDFSNERVIELFIEEDENDQLVVTEK